MATPFSTEPAAAGGISGKAIGIAAAAVVLVLLVVGITFRHPAANPGAVLPPDTYAPQLDLGGITLSEATNGGGGKVTYVDGVAANHGGKTLTAATVQVTFATDDGSGPQRQTVPLTLIRTRVPYVDLEPVPLSRSRRASGMSSASSLKQYPRHGTHNRRKFAWSTPKPGSRAALFRQNLPDRPEVFACLEITIVGEPG